MKFNISLIFFTLLFTLTTFSQVQQKPFVFVAPTEDGFSNFITAALIENKVPIEITADEGRANYIIVSSGIVKGQNRWYDTVFGAEKDRNQGSMKVIRVRDKSIVWASSTGDKSFWFSGLKNMGQAKVANRLARKLKRDLKQVQLDRGNSISNEQSNRDQAEEILKKESVNAPEQPKKQPRIPPTTDGRGYNDAGYFAFNRKEYANAESSYREAIAIEPLNSIYHNNLATALNAQRKFDEAEVEILTANRLEPNEKLFIKNMEIIRSNKNLKTFTIIEPKF